MAVGEIPASLAGNIGQDPTVRYLPNSETPMCDIRIASHERKWDNDQKGWVDGPAMWTLVRCYKALAEHVAASLHRGDRVVVIGKWVYREWDADGQKKSMHYVEASDVGLSTLFGPIGGPADDGEAPM